MEHWELVYIFHASHSQVHKWKFHESGGKGLQSDQWAIPFCSHWPIICPPLIFPQWFGKWNIRLLIFFKLLTVVSIFRSLGNFIRLLTLFVVSVFWSLGNFIRLFTFFKLFVSIFRSLGNFIRLLTLFVVSVFWCLGNFIRLVTLFVVSVFWSLGNFIRLVTLFIISLNCSQFMWESLGMATFSCFLL